MRYTIQFPLQSPLPTVSSIIYNGQTLCNGQPPSSSSTRIHLFHVLTTTGRPQSTNVFGLQSNYYQQLLEQKVNTQPNPQQSPQYYQQPQQYYPEPPQRPQVQKPQENLPLPFEEYEEVTPKPVQTRPTQTRPPVTRPPVTRPPQTRPPVTKAPVTQPPAPVAYEPEVVPPYVAPPPEPSNTYYQTNAQSEDDICGVPVRKSQTLAVGGQEVARGEFPWIAAITKQYTNLHCGGTLVSRQTVLTAAHCVVDADGETLPTRDLYIHLGKSSLTSTPSGNEVVQPKRIIAHDDYIPEETAKIYDIAVIVLRRRIVYNDYIRPICLWNGPDNFNSLINEKGIVVGWGKDITGHTTKGANKVLVTIVSRETCHRSNVNFESYLVPGTFCAGERDGTGPCNGDSGGG